MKKIIIVLGCIVVVASLIIYQNRPVSIIRQSSATAQRTAQDANTFSISGYNPGYSGTEKGRIIFVTFRSNATTGGGACPLSDPGYPSAGVTYGGVKMRFAGGSTYIGAQANGSALMAFIINPPSGAQDIVFTSIGGNFQIMVNIVAYYSDSDYSFRLGHQKSSINSGTSATTTVTTAYQNSWSIGMTNNASSTTANTQTITEGTYVTDVGGTALTTVDSNGVIGLGVDTGVGASMPSSAQIFQSIVTFLPIRRGSFFLDLIK